MNRAIQRIAKYGAAAAASVALTIGSIGAVHAQAAPAVQPAAAQASAAAWTPVDSARLGQARGGFSTSTGLELSLGIERTVSLNGDLITRSTVQVADVRAMTAEQASAVQDAFSSVNLVQNGAKNTIDSRSLVPGTFVQNTLNDQMIGTRTVISTTVNSAGMMKELNFMSSVRDASLNALGGR